MFMPLCGDYKLGLNDCNNPIRHNETGISVSWFTVTDDLQTQHNLNIVSTVQDAKRVGINRVSLPVPSLTTSCKTLIVYPLKGFTGRHDSSEKRQSKTG